MAENMDETEDLFKALQGSPVKRFPHKLIPLLAAMGYYKGLREPRQATSVTFAILKRAATAQLVRTIIETRVRQVQPFCHRSTDPNQPGYHIKMRDADERPSAGDKKRMDKIADILDEGGVRWQRPSDGHWGAYTADGLQRALPLPQCIGALVRDMLILDTGCLWLNPGVNTRELPVATFLPVDASLIRKALPELPPEMAQDVSGYEAYMPTIRSDLRVVEHVMIRADAMVDLEEQVIAEYGPDELAYIVRNPRTDWWTYGYGFSELETALNLVVGQVNAINYNTSIFTHSNIPPAVMMISGNYSEEALEDFLTSLIMQIGGPGKWHKIPVLFGDQDAKMQLLPMRQGQRDDLAWRDYILYCINALCASYYMAAEEINFQTFLTRGGQLTGEGGAERIAFSRETGLHSLLRVIESQVINQPIVRRFYADPATGYGPYEAEFTGKEPVDEDRVHRQRLERVSSGFSALNEERAQTDRAPYRDPKNQNLWDRIHTLALEKIPHLRFDPVRLDEICEGIYRKHAGEFRRWPDLPINATALHARSQEIQEEQGGPQGEMPPGLEQMMTGEAGGPQRESEPEHPEQPRGLRARLRSTASRLAGRLRNWKGARSQEPVEKSVKDERVLEVDIR